ncbi:MAG: hypothetical protein MI806_24750, partial [Minwuiales bacterium]|nr:hypothetical protein [Minwuiales bacterium]
FVPEIKPTREYSDLAGRRCIDFTPTTLKGYDAALICTDHDGVAYDTLVENAALVVDTRNATRALRNGHGNVVMA